MGTIMLRRLFAALAAALVGASAQAQLIDRGGLYFDPSTNLEWLDLEATKNNSYAHIQVRTGAGGDLFGWQLASRSQVRTMFNFDVVVLDFEAKEVTPKYWEPTCCSIYSQTHGWVWWWAEEGARFMPFSPEAMKIGHNAVAYDRKYIETEYSPPLHNREVDIEAYSCANPYPGIVRGWADTMQLAQIIGGAGGEDVSSGRSSTI